MSTTDEQDEPRPDGNSWTVEFEYEFTFDDDRVENQRDADLIGSLYVDEAVRNTVVEELRDRRKLNVLVGVEGHYGHGSLKTYGIVRALADWKDVPEVNDAFEKAEWFWEQLHVALGTQMGRRIVLRNKRSALMGVHPTANPTAAARSRLRARSRRWHRTAPVRFGLWDQASATLKIAVASTLLLLPYACDYFDRQEQDRRWSEHALDRPIDIQVALPSVQPQTEPAPTTAARCAPVREVRHESGGFQTRTLCLP
jgi:hypothetical protein